MPISKKPSSNAITKPIGLLFKQFHLTIFFIFVVGALAWAVVLINQVLTTVPEDDSYVSPISAGSIDQATLERIQSLHTSSDPGTQPNLPSGRINPFGE